MKARPATVVFGVGLVVRLAVAVWAAHAFPPAADGTYYDIIARRIAEGHGYTWLWPDGAVTYAAHYPVGYPAMVGLGYAIFGPRPVVAMVLNALLGAAGASATYALSSAATSRRLAIAAGLAVALHPALVPYTAALMTEGVTASLLVIAAAIAQRARRDAGRSRIVALVALGLTLGLATLVRPQSLALAPLLGWLAVDPGEVRIATRSLVAVATMALAVLVCTPWTLRNCARMDRCALVSVNGGWNLAIGAQTPDGAWHAIDVPEPCKTVFQEAAKDACFGDAARATILAAPGAWLARMPAKLRATFDYFGAAPWYLRTSNGARFGDRAKIALGTVETLAARIAIAGALVTVMRYPGPRRRARMAIAIVGLAACVLVPGAIAYVACALGLALLGRAALERAPVVLGATLAIVAATAATHAVFFGAGRYGLVVVPLVTALAFVRRRDGDART